MAKKNRLLNILVWLSKILSVFLSFLFVGFIVGEGVPDFNKISSSELLQFLSFFVMIFGLIFSLKSQGTGGILALLGYMLFCMIERNLWPGSILPLFLLASLLNIYCWLRLKSKDIVNNLNN